MHKKAIVLAGHGSRHPGAMAALAAFAEAARAAYPDFQVVTARTMGRKLASTREVGGVRRLPVVLGELRDAGVTVVAVQSLHVVPGEEYHEILACLRRFQENGRAFGAVSVGGPLLADLADLDRVAAGLVGAMPADRAEDEAVVLMGHGAPPPGEGFYALLGERLSRLDGRMFLGTLPSRRDAPCLDILRIRRELLAAGLTRAMLVPLFTVAGVHACQDLAGQADTSWRGVLAKAGVRCRAVLAGLIESEPLAAVWREHLSKAVARLG